MVGLILLGCAAHIQGVVVEDAVRDAEGTDWRVDGLDAQLIRQLDECTVSIDGRRVGKRVVVEDWSVLAAADGSAPYLGLAREHGNNVVLDDRNSGSTLILQSSTEDLKGLAGHQVLVVGYVAAPHVVMVMGWQLLD